MVENEINGKRVLPFDLVRRRGARALSANHRVLVFCLSFVGGRDSADDSAVSDSADNRRTCDVMNESACMISCVLGDLDVPQNGARHERSAPCVLGDLDVPQNGARHESLIFGGIGTVVSAGYRVQGTRYMVHGTGYSVDRQTK